MDHCPEGRDPPYWRVSIVSPHRRWRSGWNRNLLLNWHRLTALEAVARLPPAGAPIIRSWSAADTALCISTIVGYVMNLTLAFLLHKRVNVVQESLNKCASGVPRLFRRGNPDRDPEPENLNKPDWDHAYTASSSPWQLKQSKMTQLSIMINNASLCLLKFLTCSFPNYPAPGFSQWWEWCLCLVCACSSCLLFQGLTMFHQGNITKPEGDM